MTTPGNAILMYHSVVPNDIGDLLSVTPEQLRGHISWMLDAGYEVVSLETIVNDLTAPTPTQKRRVALTFDDGCENFYTTALPVLSDLSVTATSFVVSGRIGVESDWSVYSLPRMLMDLDQILAVADAGITIGAHTITHCHLTQLSQAEMVDQLTHSRDFVIGLGQEFLSLAYPWGEYGIRECAAAKDLGFACAVSTISRMVDDPDQRFDLGRLSMMNDTGTDELKRLLEA